MSQPNHLPADKAAAIRKQIEFYFSDVNISRDAFMKDRIAEDREGFVPAAVFANFKRIGQILAGTPFDDAAIVAALAGTESLVVDATRKAIRRKAPLPDAMSVDNETIYAKPIAVDATLEELEAFFGQFGKVLAVWRRHQQAPAGAASAESSVKPSVFVVFDSVAAVEKAVKTPSTFKGAALEILSKRDYLAKKGVSGDSSSRRVTSGGAATAKPTSPPMPKGASIRIGGVGAVKDIKAIRSLWDAALSAKIRYIILGGPGAEGAEGATVIFQDAATRDAMSADLAAKGTTLSGAVPVVRNLTEDEDNTATAAAQKEIEDRSAAKEESGGRGRGGRGRGGFRGGRGGGRGGKRDRDA